MKENLLATRIADTWVPLKFLQKNTGTAKSRTGIQVLWGAERGTRRSRHTQHWRVGEQSQTATSLRSPCNNNQILEVCAELGTRLTLSRWGMKVLRATVKACGLHQKSAWHCQSSSRTKAVTEVLNNHLTDHKWLLRGNSEPRRKHWGARGCCPLLRTGGC